MVISAEKAGAIAKYYAETNYKNFSSKNMQMLSNRLYNRGAGGQDYLFGWAEENVGAYTLNRVYVSVNAYTGT
ncbi:MAG: hypothetical protein CVV34_02645 [Methanomicrobiales archaeon HGW-Methanomicrobiales-5]|nr:MAG: hypothetical protein CVV34_02645 [Methanomicrobiales archaeon HGW-Methanomicrobiales-5]